MDTIFRGDLVSTRGRALAWADSLLVDHAILRVAWSNFGVVVPGRLYRSNHPPPGRLASLTRRLGLRTVINLRGRCGNGSDALSREEAARLGLRFMDAELSSGRPPRREQVLVLAEALLGGPEPALVHCKSGADRAGFAAAIFLILQGRSVAEAKRQLSPRHGHWRRSRAGVLDAFLERFAREAEGRRDFLDWVREEYDSAALGREFRSSHFADFITRRVLVRE
jgi:protein tyrosine/serine phosphatase